MTHRGIPWPWPHLSAQRPRHGDDWPQHRAKKRRRRTRKSTTDTRKDNHP